MIKDVYLIEKGQDNADQNIIVMPNNEQRLDINSQLMPLMPLQIDLEPAKPNQMPNS